MPNRVLPSALHELCSIHGLYAAHSSAQCTTCNVFTTPSACLTRYCPVHYKHCVQNTVCMPYTVLLSALLALCSTQRFCAVHSTSQCITCNVLNTPIVCRIQYCQVHYKQCVQHTVGKPYTLLPSALHALFSLHHLYAVQSTTQRTICNNFNTPFVCRKQYRAVQYKHCVKYTVCMP